MNQKVIKPLKLFPGFNLSFLNAQSGNGQSWLNDESA
jgi:hypothetical protein